MITLRIEHPITDYATWAGAFGHFADARRSAGVRAERVRQPLGDVGHVHVDLDFDTVESAEAFRQFLLTVVWAVPQSAPALAGTPTTVLLESPQE